MVQQQQDHPEFEELLKSHMGEIMVYDKFRLRAKEGRRFK